MKDLREGANINVDIALDSDNADKSILVWYTHFKGKKLQVLLSTDFKKIHRTRVVNRFPLSDRTTNISPREWYPRSVPDLLEDKHRARANMLNAAVEIVREQTKPIYLAKEGSVRLDMLENAEA